MINLGVNLFGFISRLAEKNKLNIVTISIICLPDRNSISPVCLSMILLKTNPPEQLKLHKKAS